MKLCILSYDAPHRKTADVSLALHMRGGFDIDYMVFPFKKRADRVVAFNHRPFQFEGPDLTSLAAFMGANVLQYRDWKAALKRYDYFLICGASLIDDEFANCGRVVNRHPGLIPLARGLDAFKWSILRNNLVGNTLHFIDSNVDSGEMIRHEITPVFPEDDIATMADRHYKNEIFLLSHFDSFVDSPHIIDFDLAEDHPPTKRMPAETEAEMLRSFDIFKEKHALGAVKHA